ncbi:uncharacterized protein LOC109720177 [Ananas comosus]|uniref:Uncharacterized protein LOC109720177 n=1 Tax=Ananas comosus TaxID=4615 RepID=A0A6P5GBH4_ANACO|nr:uncharacterized protein LOC109720177 [Ananas comosus]
MEFDRRYGSSPPSLKQKLRSSVCFSCCFGAGGDADDEYGGDGAPSLLRSSSTWIRARAQEIPDLVARMRRRRRFAGDFGYDPLSYARNFDEGAEDDAADPAGEGFRYRNFSSRLPASPAPPHAAMETSRS